MYGFGVMRVRTTPPHAEVQASGVSVETSGLSLLWGSEARGLVVGFDRRQRLNVFDTATPLEVNYTPTSFWQAELQVLPAGTAATSLEPTFSASKLKSDTVSVHPNP